MTVPTPTPLPAGLTRRVWGMRLLFGALGAVFGSWAVRIPDIAHNVGLNSSTLGVALLVLAVGSLLGMPASGLVLSKFSLRTAAAFFAAMLAVTVTVVGAAQWAPWLFGAVLLFGLANGVYGVVINTAASHLEHQLDRPLLPGCHAAFSIATLVASLVGGWAIAADLAPLPHIAIVAAAVGVPALMCARWVDDAPQPERFRLPRPRSAFVWIASGVAFTALFAEGAVTDWSAYFLQAEILNGPDAKQAWGYSFFAIAMAAGRAAGGTLITKLGEQTLLIGCSALAPVGYLTVVTSTNLPVALAGFACIGLGLSNLYPVMISLAARGIPADQRQDAVASVSSIGYFGFLLGPSIIGGLSGALTIRGSLATPIAVLLVGAAGIAYLLTQVRETRKTT